MGNQLTKLSCAKHAKANENSKGYNDKPGITTYQQRALTGIFQHIISNASVDFENNELQDIQKAVFIMLTRLKKRVNSRGIFTIANIVPTGSMEEKTSLWKFLNYCYLEFDFLANLESSIKQCKSLFARNGCGCIKIVNPPVKYKHLAQYYNREDGFDAETIKDKEVISDLFLKEINHCVTSSCDCLSLKWDIGRSGGYNISFQPESLESQSHGCDACTVDMTSGTLSVNKDITNDRASPNKCSLILLWTSKARSLLAPDELLLRKREITSLPIHVDFLPALESLKPTPCGVGDEHDYFVVPKGCNVCRTDDFGYQYKWRKSWCVRELNVFTTEMSEKHRRCVQIIKYLLESCVASYRSYHLKTIVLSHHTSCIDTSIDCVNCVTEIIRDLAHAYNSKVLFLNQTNMNILKREGGVWCFIQYDRTYAELLRKLDDVSGNAGNENDPWNAFISGSKEC